jgi:hypothetical protein
MITKLKLTHYFNDGIVAEGANDLKVIVVDNVGNSTFESRFLEVKIIKSYPLSPKQRIPLVFFFFLL